MPLERNFLTPEEINNYRHNFHRFMTPKYIDEVLTNLDRQPVWYDRNLSEVPEINAGITICRSCRHMYWVTPSSDTYRSIKGFGQETIGPFCEPCSDDFSPFENSVSIELLKEQKEK